MSSDPDSRANVTAIQHRRRYWRRKSAPASWWPWGIAPLAGLVVLFLFGALLIAPRIQAEVREEVAARFENAGIPVSRVISDGQQVTIDVTAPATQAALVRALARATECNTWAGELICPTDVSVRLTAPAAAKPPAGAAAMPSGEVASASDVTPHGLLAASTGSAAGPDDTDTPAFIEREDCNARFSDMLSRTTIRFRTGSADIDEGSEELLSRLADTATRCPGNIAIEGHTDNQGDAELNRALSRQRALAVQDALVARGVASDRLRATGFGAMHPIADNDTAAGRARNRRIDIRVSDTN